MTDIIMTENAAKHISKLMIENKGSIGLRLGIRTSGCSGYAYQMQMAEQIEIDDVVITHGDAKVIIANSFLPMLKGLEIDFIEEGLAQMFRFNNPNAIDECGCGESFNLS